MDRASFRDANQAYLDRPAPLSRRTRLIELLVDGETAAIEMEWEISWPDITYQFYHHVLTVRDGKIQAMRMYLDLVEGMKFFGQPPS